ASTESTRSAGTRSQFDTEGCEKPIRRASSLPPPAARGASSKPGPRLDSLRFFFAPSDENRFRGAIFQGDSSRLWPRDYSASAPPCRRRDGSAGDFSCTVGFSSPGALSRGMAGELSTGAAEESDNCGVGAGSLSPKATVSGDGDSACTA